MGDGAELGHGVWLTVDAPMGWPAVFIRRGRALPSYLLMGENLVPPYVSVSLRRLLQLDWSPCFASGTIQVVCQRDNSSGIRCKQLIRY